MWCLAPHTRGNWQRIRADWTQQTSIDSGELEVWADAFFPGHLVDLHIPGAVLIVVQNGEILLAKGYGNANVDAQTGMDPERMALRIGSVSKLFVATAVMQLVEQDRLDLHADVNRYLDTFQLGEDYTDPVTLAHLLTHSYSNHGYALAAYERLAWYESGALHQLLFEGFGWLWGALAVAWPLIGFLHLRLRRTSIPSLARRAYWLVLPMSALNVAFLLSLNDLFWRSPGTAEGGDMSWAIPLFAE